MTTALSLPVTIAVLTAGAVALGLHRLSSKDVCALDLIAVASVSALASTGASLLGAGVIVITAAGVAAGAAVSAAVLDLRTGMIADLQSATIAVTALLAAPELHPWAPYISSIGGMIFAGAILGVAAAAFQALRGQSGLGVGDIGLAAALGGWSGIGFVGLGLLVASVSTLIVGLSRGASGQTRLPFAPGLSAGFIAAAGAHIWLSDAGA